MKKHISILFCAFCSFSMAQQGQNNNPNFTTDEIVIRINHKYLNREVIGDSTDQLFPLHHVLNNQGVSQFTNLAIPGLLNFPMKKIFPYLSWKDTLTKTLTGENLTVPPFWATFIIRVPQKKKFCLILKKLTEYPQLIDFAHPNYRVEKTSPNDSLYYRQESLNGSLALPNAGINVEEAWTIETGEKFVKVGVLDSGIDSTNADLDVLFGGPYYDPWNVSSFTGYGVDQEGHGTQVAAIIGAKRNNLTGTAGIAGGNGSNEEGVSLIDLHFPFNSNSGTAYICAATVDAARTVGSYWTYPNFGPDNYYFKKTPGFGIQIQNNSFVIRTDLPRCEQEFGALVTIPGDNVNIDEPQCELCREAFLFSYKSGVIHVAARGNSGQLNQFQTETYVDRFYPQNFPDSWLISVGASGYDGTTIRNGINQGYQDAQAGFYSLYGGKMDLIAPGSDSIVYGPLPAHFNEPYRWFHGTSAAAPHVTGVVALLLSHYNKDCYSNKNLAVEDVEYILETSATDVLTPGFDTISGAGRLNAGAALKMIENPTKQIVHPENLLSSVEVDRDTMALRYNNAFVPYNWGPISSGFQLANLKNYQVVKVLYENTYSFAEYISPTTEVRAFWSRPSASNSVKSYLDTSRYWAGPALQWEYTFDNFDMTPSVVVTNIDTAAKTITTQGYYYHFIARYNDVDVENFEFDTTHVDSWLPINPEIDTARMPVSLYLIDPLQNTWFDYPCDSVNLPWDSTFVPLNGIDELRGGNFLLYPNPSADELTLEFEHMPGNKVIQVFDLQGKLLLRVESSENKCIFTVSNLSEGMYVLSCSHQNKTYHRKLFKK